jgi:predicted MPP superfamily phosphohydrolase
MAAAYATLILLALFGHAALWIGLVNRTHSTGMPRWAVKWLSRICLAAVIVVPLVLAAVAWSRDLRGERLRTVALLEALWSGGWYYFVPCLALFGIVGVTWIRRRVTYRRPAALKSLRTEQADIAQQLGYVPVHGRFARLCQHIPANQLFQLSIEEREIEFPRLPAALDGLSVVHLSDFHFTGRIGPEYFLEIVRRSNAMTPDLVALTGDLVDHAPYLDWLPETVGQLRARVGVFFILGNHDLRTGDVSLVRRTLTDLGLVDVGGRWITVEVDGEKLVLAGNELPWISPAADMRTCVAAAPGIDRDRPFRVLLSHSPDQFAWAQRWDFDLMLAGHTHGGQFCLPWIGPILTPCWHGVKYSSGTFSEGRTVLHVSRGVSGELPLRLNCRPELNRMVLRAAPAYQWPQRARAGTQVVNSIERA